ncbi:hypothetical protein CI109_106610 [Kwoniella shandongensis]|uniref:Uncharacterized protein n=1 Tax=Kwoniella shandongensis TaxID=1734106 RepID=A0A5M6BP45_9TREE|nr:uncharacterized protein CI109_007152 [Kwoniella shandongensis]KAA5524497.1 hypothetical protein CI109_007152 [Kwoniella shandongensis]
MDFVYQQIASRLPPDLQALFLNPPSLSNPGAFIPALKIAFPYAKYIIVFLAVYIVWSFVSGILGYFSRFLRFSLKIGPLIGLIGWLMAGSGQGSMDELFAVVKQWTGLSPNNAAANLSPGLASLANLFGANQATSGTKRANKGKKSSWTDPNDISSRTRSKKAADGASNSGGDILSSILNSATGNNEASTNQWQDVVQDYVKNSLVKAAGLDWLLGKQEPAKEDAKAKTWKSR